MSSIAWQIWVALSFYLGVCRPDLGTSNDFGFESQWKQIFVCH
jgi:hypothetical protein